MTIKEEKQSNKSSLKEEQDDGEESENPLLRVTKFNQTDFEEIAKKYVKYEELESVENPEKELKKCIGVFNQQNSDWNQQFDACNSIRRLSKHH